MLSAPPSRLSRNAVLVVAAVVIVSLGWPALPQPPAPTTANSAVRAGSGGSGASSSSAAAAAAASAASAVSLSSSASSAAGGTAHSCAFMRSSGPRDERARCRLAEFGDARSVGLSLHLRTRFLLVRFDRDDDTSGNCLTGEEFHEQGLSDFIVEALRISAARRSEPLPGCGDELGRAWYLDVGANIGVHALAVAAAGFGVVAVEGMPSTAARLQCSKLLNGFEHLYIAAQAAGPEERAHACMHRPNNHNMGAVQVGAGEDAAGCVADYATSMTTLDALMARLGLEVAPAVVKIDAEGSELGVVRGYDTFIRRHRPPYVFIELLDVPTRCEVLSWFVERGYRAFRGDMETEYTDAVRALSRGGKGQLCPWEDSCGKNYALVRADDAVALAAISKDGELGPPPHVAMCG